MRNTKIPVDTQRCMVYINTVHFDRECRQWARPVGTTSTRCRDRGGVGVSYGMGLVYGRWSSIWSLQNE
jgi:hypothetical protein